MVKNISLEKVNNVNETVTKACVDIIIVDILDGMPIHGINKGYSNPFWMQLNAYEWWENVVSFLESILSYNDCTLIMCNAKMARLQEKIMSYALRTRDRETKFCLREHIKIITITNSLL